MRNLPLVVSKFSLRSKLIMGKSTVTDVTFDVFFRKNKIVWKIMAKSDCNVLWYISTSVTVLYNGIVISR